MNTLAHALANAYLESGVATIAARDAVALQDGNRYRCIYRTKGGRRLVAYGETCGEALDRACDALCADVRDLDFVARSVVQISGD